MATAAEPHNVSPRPRLLVTGGAGYLGRALLRAAGDRALACTRFQSEPPSQRGCEVIDLDLRQPEATLRAFRAWRPAVVLHTALSNGSEAEIAGLAGAAEGVAEAAAACGARLIHLSSDAVLSGVGAPFTDDAQAAPLTAYGQAKAEAERLVLTRHPEATVVRTSLIYGLTPLDKHHRWVLEALRDGREVHLYHDEIVCPIWVTNLAEALLELAALPAPGRLNLAGPQPLSRWELGLKMLAALGQSPGPLLRPASVCDAVPARPGDRRLDLSRASALLCTPLLTVDEALMRQTGAGA